MLSRLDSVFLVIVVALSMSAFAEAHISSSRPILKKHYKTVFLNQVFVVLLLALLISLFVLRGFVAGIVGIAMALGAHFTASWRIRQNWIRQFNETWHCAHCEKEKEDQKSLLRLLYQGIEHNAANMARPRPTQKDVLEFVVENGFIYAIYEGQLDSHETIKLARKVYRERPVVNSDLFDHAILTFLPHGDALCSGRYGEVVEHFDLPPLRRPAQARPTADAVRRRRLP